MDRSFMGMLRGLARKSPAFRKLARKARSEASKNRFLIRNKGIRTEDHSVFFTCFAGRNYSDSPKALYQAMVKDPYFADYKYYWAFMNPEKYRFLEDYPNTHVVKTGSMGEDRAMGRSKYWITNYRLLDHFLPKRDQVYVQCWHGTPLKRLGYDLMSSDNAMNDIGEIREKYRTDAERFRYMLSPSAWTSKVFASAWNLKEFGREDTIIEEGYPRNDYLVNASQEEIDVIREKLNLPTGKKVLLYTPTWRDNQFDKEKGYVYSLGIDFDKLKEKLGEDWVILFRTHYLVANTFDFAKYEGFIMDVSDYDDVNHLYLVSDALLTDYSSTFFDYAILEKPIFFYMYDREEYESSLRGFYLDPEELPGRIVDNEEGLTKELAIIGDWKPDEVYNRFNEKFNYLNDGQASERVLERLFKENR